MTTEPPDAEWLALLTRAHRAEAVGNIRKAVRLLRDALAGTEATATTDVARSDAWRRLARLYARLHQWKNADDAYSMASITTPTPWATAVDLLSERWALEYPGDDDDDPTQFDVEDRPAEARLHARILIGPRRRFGPAQREDDPSSTATPQTGDGSPSVEVERMPDLQSVLDLVGLLEDDVGDDTTSERFRHYLLRAVTTAAHLTPLANAAAQTSDTQHRRALHDLVNHAGRLLGFDVEFGAYEPDYAHGGYAGLWCTGEFELRVLLMRGDLDPLDADAVLDVAGRFLIDRSPEARTEVGFLAILVGASDEQVHAIADLFTPTMLIHVVTLPALLTLLTQIDGGVISRQAAVDLLLPRSVLVDSWVRLLDPGRSRRPSAGRT